MTVILDEKKCTGCGLCVNVCPEGAISLENKAVIDSSLCNGCGVCVAECPQQALFFQEDGLAVPAPDSSAPGARSISEPEVIFPPRVPYSVARPAGFPQSNKRGLLERIVNFIAEVSRGSRSQFPGRGINRDRSFGQGRGMGRGQGRGQGRGGGARGRGIGGGRGGGGRGRLSR